MRGSSSSGEGGFSRQGSQKRFCASYHSSVHARLSGFYSDRFGREAITIDYSEGTCRTEIRGVAFRGCLDELCPEDPLPPGAPFVLYEADDLCSCTFEWTLPVLLDGPARVRAAELACTLRIGEPEDIDQELRLVLREDGAAIVAAVITDHNFEDGMWQLTRQSLPPGVSLRACSTCRLAGQPGDQACLRTRKRCGGRELSGLASWATVDGAVNV